MMDFETASRELEAFETDPWAVSAILDRELMTEQVIDPCCGTRILSNEAERRGYSVTAIDVRDWSEFIPNLRAPDYIIDFLEAAIEPQPESTFFMNPPFSRACDFVDRAFKFKPRKIVCFQRWAWRESSGRRDWWAKNPPARIWICGERATCWRFDIPHECIGADRCGRGQGKGSTRCRDCMAGSTTAHAWFVWERGHKGAEIVHDLWKGDP